MTSSVAQAPTYTGDGLSASAGLAASLATASVSFPWVESSSRGAYPLIAPPGSGASAGPPEGAAPGAAGRWAAAAGFAGLFRPSSHIAGGEETRSSSGEAFRGSLKIEKDDFIRRALEVTPVSQATAAAASRASGTLARKGTLCVRILSAKRLVNRDTGLLGDVSDPYVKVRTDGKEYRTPTICNDLNPTWSTGNEFSFSASEISSLLEVEVMNANMIRDDSLGKTTLSIWDLAAGHWHRRCEVLEGGGGAELTFEVRLDETGSGNDRPATRSYFARGRSHSPKPRESFRSAKEDVRSGVRIGLPADWEDGDFWGIDPQNDLEGWPLGPAMGASTSPVMRPRTFSVPDDLFGDARVEVGDPTIGPAFALHYTTSHTSSRTVTRASEAARQLACLEEDLRMNILSGIQAVGGNQTPKSRLSEDAPREEAAITKVLEKEKAAKKDAQDDLAKILSRLQDLEQKAKAAAAAKAESEAAAAAAKAAAEAAAAAPPGPPPAAASTSGAAAATAAGSLGSSSSAFNPFSTAGASAQPPVVSSGVEAKASAPPPATPSVPSSGGSGGVAYQERFTKALAYLKQVQPHVEQFKKDPAHKDFRNQVKKVINLKMGQISSTWGRIQECTSAICNAMEQSTKDSDPAKKQFAEYTMALRIVDDAEVGIRSQPRAAWAVAQVVCRIFDKFPSVQDLFSGLMCEACPYLRPDYTGSQVGRQGRAPGQKEREAFTEFADRMVAYNRLWLAVVVTQGELGTLWNWFAKTLNQPPSPISAPMVHAALDATGADAQERYGKQFAKLVECIDRDYMADLEKLQQQTKGEESDRLRASHARLRRWIDDFRRSGRAPPPEGRYVQARTESELNPNI